MTKYDKDPLITQYVNNLTWYITPVLNPDGYDYTRSSKDVEVHHGIRKMIRLVNFHILR